MSGKLHFQNLIEFVDTELKDMIKDNTYLHLMKHIQNVYKSKIVVKKIIQKDCDCCNSSSDDDNDNYNSSTQSRNLSFYGI